MKKKFSKRIAIYLSLIVIITTFLSGCQSGASTNANKGTAIKEGGKIVFSYKFAKHFQNRFLFLRSKVNLKIETLRHKKV